MNLYVHVPFCVKKCNYCAFYSLCPEHIDWESYTDRVLEQLDYFLRILVITAKAGNKPRITTLFFGGGTPSLMPVRYAEKIRRKLDVENGAEWTLEANPKTLSSLELKDWKNLGLSRLSIGMQSFNDDELRFLGRIHTAKDALEMLVSANDLGLRVSGDFIYGLPGQSTADVVRLCGRINQTGLRHASLYELTIENGTKFQNLPHISETLSAEMYLAIQDALKLKRYEVSNYGEPCLHNSNIWAGEEYIGVGESAAGRLAAGENGEWIETKIINGEIVTNKLTARDRAVEMIMTGLRTAKGVSLSAPIREAINWKFVERNPVYFQHYPESLKMSDNGLLLLDFLLKDIIK